jgi:anti-sigma28 factor (negative regulator of flagellin synthesis)
MDFETWQKMETAALKVIGDFAAAGIRVTATTSNGDSMTTLERVGYLKNKSRATDARPTRDSADAILPVSVDGEADEAVKAQRMDHAIRAIRTRRIAQLKTKIAGSRGLRATDAGPQSDMDFYTQCAAECTRLS